MWSRYDSNESVKKYILPAILGLSAIIFLSQMSLPLVDYDEATYAKVVVDTIRSGDISTFTLSGQPWFEKPPLYFWLAIASVSLFGEHEFAFRLPGFLASLVALYLVYEITRRLTGNPLTAAFALALTFTTGFFFHLANQARLDPGVLMCILASLYFFIRGWEKERYLLGIFPALAIGFLFKSFIIAVAVPILFIYSFFYKEWTWLKSRELWSGLGVALIIWLPWHFLQSVRFGWAFWDEYLLHHVFQRSLNTLSGHGNYLDYIYWFWAYDTLWFVTVVLVMCSFIILLQSKKLRVEYEWRTIAAPLSAAAFLLIFFTALRSHLSPYILPTAPFIAMFIAIFSEKVAVKRRSLAIAIVLVTLAAGFMSILSPAHERVMSSEYDETAIGKIYKSRHESHSAPIYAIDWPILETLNFYGDTKVQYRSLQDVHGTVMEGPLYIVVPVIDVGPLFYHRDRMPVGNLSALNILYKGADLVLYYSNQDVRAGGDIAP